MRVLTWSDCKNFGAFQREGNGDGLYRVVAVEVLEGGDGSPLSTMSFEVQL